MIEEKFVEDLDYWHKADIPTRSTYVCFWADIETIARELRFAEVANLVLPNLKI